ncbi:MAG: hypothetical protein ABIO70_18890 [Pseudomonadota bacterium]
MTNLDIVKLKLAIEAIAEEIHRQKHRIRTTPQPWAQNPWPELRRAKARATLLCSI